MTRHDVRRSTGAKTTSYVRLFTLPDLISQLRGEAEECRRSCLRRTLSPEIDAIPTELRFVSAQIRGIERERESEGGSG